MGNRTDEFDARSSIITGLHYVESNNVGGSLSSHEVNNLMQNLQLLSEQIPEGTKLRELKSENNGLYRICLEVFESLRKYRATVARRNHAGC